jgi:RNA-directed DNA polymerase
LKKFDLHAPLWDQITNFQNLLLAFHKGARGKRSKPSVASFEFKLEENLIGLQQELLAGEYI